jgi:enamine deaminase RidA (YjgF/YER057c/UK114 family)
MVAGDTIEIQTRQTLANVGAALEAAGASLRDVVKVTGHTYGCIALFAHE